MKHHPIQCERRPPWVACLAAAFLLLGPGGALSADEASAISSSPLPAAVVDAYGALEQPLSDRLGWDSLTQTVEQVYAGLPPDQRAQACVLTSNYGEAGALSQLSAPGRLPPIISAHNNYYLWGPGTCTGQVLILVGYPLADAQGTYADVVLAATERCQDCVSFERDVPIVVVSNPTTSINLMQQWLLVKHYD